MKSIKVSHEFQDLIELGEKVIVSDPCYSRDVWCMGVIDNVLPGKYKAVVRYSEDKRVKSLTVFHETMKESSIRKGIKANFIVGVDSGQAGIFCDSIYPKENDIGDYDDKNSFYGACCNATLGDGYHAKQRLFELKNDYNRLSKMIENKDGDLYLSSRIEDLKTQIFNLQEVPWTQSGLIMGRGVVSSSGWGDGSYSCYIYKKDDKVIGIRIFFL
jgi:hypothetical protein